MRKILLKSSRRPYFLKLRFNDSYEVSFGLTRALDKIYSVTVRKTMMQDDFFHEINKIPDYYKSTDMIKAIFEKMKSD
jgi:hypothetical protein